MNLFGRREVKGTPDLAELLQRMGQVESTVRQLEVEQLTLHDKVRKWMRRAIAAERVVERAMTTGVHASTSTPGTPGLPTRPATMRGARGRIYVRKLEELAQGQAAGLFVPGEPDEESHMNGSGAAAPTEGE